MEGLTQLQEGVDTLSSGASVFETGISSLAEGSQDLDEGAGEMKDGTEEFKTETADIDTEIENKVEEMVQEFSGEAYVPVSFVSEKNTNVEAVQFAFQTDPIQIEEEEVREESPAETPASGKKSEDYLNNSEKTKNRTHIQRNYPNLRQSGVLQY